MLVASLQEVGLARSIVIDESGNILAGNGTVQAAAECGMERVQVVDADGETIVAVRRTGLTPEQKRRLSILDNRTGELAEWDAQVLAELAATGTELDDLFAPDELNALLGDLAQPVAGAGGDEFDPTPDDGPTRVQHGEVWRIGPHRIVCGDCTDAATVVKLLHGARPEAVVSDPPYSILGGGCSTAGKGIEAAFDRQFFRAWFASLWAKIAPRMAQGFAAWMTIDWRGAVAIEEALVGSGQRLAALGIWDRGGLGMGYALRKTFEAFVVIVSDGWQRVRTDEPDVWRHEWTPGNRSGEHSAEKPLELIERAVGLLGGSTVYDPFLGSGTTLIAAHRLGRVCYGCEIEPRYCDVILRRAEAEGIGPIERVEDVQAG